MNLNFSKPWISGRLIFLVLLLCALVLSWHVTQAATVTVSWQNPTTNLDGSVIPPSGAGSITGTRIEFGSCIANAFGAKAGEFSVPAPATSAISPDLQPGTYCFQAFAQNTYGTESDASNVASKTILTPKPAPPVLSVTQNTAYSVTIKHFRLVLGPPAGTVPIGTACIPNTRLYGTAFYAVPVKSVTLTSRIASPLFLAKCALS